ncbi:TetR/AcrR family transcriptional regulator [Rhodococcus sp. NPDC003994]|uniref:TetR/AcrR family transcriptional regulator n=1 Tax=Rhodococcoides kroppenstedtii TaxID=293050 RepID=A0ABS7NTN5_9NOCA|nr:MULTISPECIES: TetR/AcrR family transcriptional regulator [Rhodococcus]AMY20378.1 HTH-type transcriptional repressor KstR2 [Rhodococcus sp. PBTS 1]MBY6313885.1 TetR/AcrR family transcriptional regulator [Rhodococcus kroppenstedtii]MBY6321388.1 TetR/AcrR family transcriptional regulator [Rhodococcus kroppenstedtii]MBY6400087.1 TetR/AcrR family transcriptional regulator [Rhodococcus kroppenstedtii]MBY6438509.1 TetR/AcrR family transcriptional regulator [Rhodococcus kroppenstedtii]
MNTRTPDAGSGGVRQRILDTALRDFHESGFHAATVRNIAKHAGCSAANVYNHFENKDEILVEILRSASDEQFTATRNAVRRASPTPPARWAAAVRAHALYTATNSRECLVANTELRYLQEVDRKRVVGSRDAQEHQFVMLAEAGVSSGDFRIDRVHTAVTAVLSMCAGIALWFRADGPLTAVQVADTYAGYALSLVGFPGGSGAAPVDAEAADMLS